MSSDLRAIVKKADDAFNELDAEVLIGIGNPNLIKLKECFRTAWDHGYPYIYERRNFYALLLRELVGKTPKFLDVLENITILTIFEGKPFLAVDVLQTMLKISDLQVTMGRIGGELLAERLTFHLELSFGVDGSESLPPSEEPASPLLMEALARLAENPCKPLTSLSPSTSELIWDACIVFASEAIESKEFIFYEKLFFAYLELLSLPTIKEAKDIESLLKPLLEKDTLEFLDNFFDDSAKEEIIRKFKRY